MFQSLFFWMLLSKKDDVELLYDNDTRFNPYFSGCFSLSTTATAAARPATRFQSLFFWMLLSKALEEAFSNVTFVVSILIFLDASL